MTDRAGLPAYEISNHAAPGEESRHNLTYWRYGEYAGVGPGAHGRFMAGGNRRATSTERNPERWAALVETGVHGMIEDVPLTRAEEADEALLMGLRLTEGIDLGRLAARTDLAPADHTINELIGLRLVQRSGPTRLSATRTGRMVLNAIVLQLAQSFVPAKTTQDTTG